MAETTGPQAGTNVVVSLEGTPVNALTTNGLEFTVNTRDVTTKDSASHKEHLATDDTWTVNIEGIIHYDETYNYEEIFAAAQAKVAVQVIFGQLTTGNPQWAGSVIITSLSQGAPDADNNTFTGTLLGTGLLIESTTA